MNKYEIIKKISLITGGTAVGSVLYNRGDSFIFLEKILLTKQENTIGAKYKDFLIMEEEKESGISKKEQGVKALSNTSNPFKGNKNGQQPKGSDVRQRCKKEYKKISGDDLKKKKTKTQYGNTVGTYCGKPSQNIPEDGGK